MKTRIGVRPDLAAARQGTVAAHMPSYLPERGSRYDDVARRPAVPGEATERETPARRAAAWAANAVRVAWRLVCAYLPWSKDPVPGWDATIKCWNTLGVPYEKARPRNPKKEAHHSHGTQTDF